MVITDLDYSNKFIEALEYLQSNYNKFPKFLIEIIAEGCGIPPAEVKELIFTYMKNGTLKLLKNEGFYYQFEKKL